MNLLEFKEIPMEQITSMYGIPIRRGNINCPFHKEDTPSCKIYKNSFYCYGCNVGGDTIKFVQAYESISFRDALTKLSEHFNIKYEYKTSYKESKFKALQDNYDILKATLRWEYDLLCDDLILLRKYSQYLNNHLHLKILLMNEKLDLIEKKLQELEDVRYRRGT